VDGGAGEGGGAERERDQLETVHVPVSYVTDGGGTEPSDEEFNLYVRFYFSSKNGVNGGLCTVPSPPFRSCM